MKYLSNLLSTLIIILLLLPNLVVSQDESCYELKYEINRVLPPFSITKDRVISAQSLTDLNKNFDPSWVKKYNSVAILTTEKGQEKRTIGSSQLLTKEQKNSLASADIGSDVGIVVKYIPDNTLKHNDEKVINYTLPVDPDQIASFPGDKEQLSLYLKNKGLGKISTESIKQYQLAAVKFTVDIQGNIINAHVFQSSSDEKIDELLLQTVKKMPTWTPAEYSDGTKVSQDFVLTVGDMSSCVINLLSINQE